MPSPLLRQNRFVQEDDYYVILDVDLHATQEEIASAYHNLARKYHPDKHHQDERSRKEAEIIFDKIRRAHEVLGDPRKRKIYDTLGSEGLKYDGWQLVRKQMTAEEIRREYLRLQKQRDDMKLIAVAKPSASFSIDIDASELFNKGRQDEYDDSEELEQISGVEALAEKLASIEISAMSAAMSVQSSPSSTHITTFSGNLTARNGKGNGSFCSKYRYNQSPTRYYDIAYDIGNGPIFSVGYYHRLNAKTSLNLRAYALIGNYEIMPGAKCVLTHKIRDDLVGKISYKEGITSPSVTTSLIYVNQKLMFELVTSYKLSKLDHVATIDFGYHLTDTSKLNVALVASSKGNIAVQYGCEVTFFDINSMGAAISFSLPSGVTLKLRFSRANQELNVPIYLSDEIHSAPIFYGTMVPLLAYYLIDRCYIRYYKELK